MPMMATQPPYTLMILEDDTPVNPREDYDNFGKMMCFHKRYGLGDEHNFSEPREFLIDLLFKRYSGEAQPVLDFIKEGNAKEAQLEYNRSTREWELLEPNFWSTSARDKWIVTTSYPASLKGKDVPDWFIEEAITALKINEMKTLIEKAGDFALLPLYLYDHSGITMSSSPFSCPWDSGQVGWIYADRQMIEKEYDVLTPETFAKAEKLLESEVKCYDYYLTNQCYGYQLYEHDVETDSCWGFLGDFRDLKDSIKDYLPDECKGLVDKLEHQYEKPNIADIMAEWEDELEVEPDDEI